MLIRDLAVFVLKAGLEAFRDLALIPAALLSGLAGLIGAPSQPDRYFQYVLRFGDRFDDFVDLFGRQARHAREPGALGRPRDEEVRVDDLVGHVEDLLVQEFERGGITAQAKDAIDRGLDALQHVVGGHAGDPTVPRLAPGAGERDGE